MQKIYTTGAGPIELGNGWHEITKPENFRCPKRVLDVANQIRAGGDGLQQVRGRMIEREDKFEPVEGTARLFILPVDGQRTERVAQVRKWLADANADELWQRDDHDADVRVLVLVHRMAALRLGFPNLYAALNDNAPLSLKNGLLDGTAWVLRPFLTFLLPLTTAARTGGDFDVMAALRMHCPLLATERLVERNVAELMHRLREDVAQLVAMFTDGSGATVRQVLSFVRDRELMRLDERFSGYLVGGEIDEEYDEQGAETQSVNAFLACAADEFSGYRRGLYRIVPV